tara:strand:+ start:99 stop:293 length:195 start_codon:yes stop_codon:yes gene_type:complete
MARIIKGAADTPRNRIISDLHRKGMSYNKISREMFRLGFDLTSQRCQQIVKSKEAAAEAARGTN